MTDILDEALRGQERLLRAVERLEAAAATLPQIELQKARAEVEVLRAEVEVLRAELASPHRFDGILIEGVTVAAYIAGHRRLRDELGDLHHAASAIVRSVFTSITVIPRAIWLDAEHLARLVRGANQ